MLFPQWEELCVAMGLLIHCTLYHVVTEGVCQHKPCFREIFLLKIERKFGHLCDLYQASRQGSFRNIHTGVCPRTFSVNIAANGRKLLARSHCLWGIVGSWLSGRKQVIQSSQLSNRCFCHLANAGCAGYGWTERRLSKTFTEVWPRLCLCKEFPFGLGRIHRHRKFTRIPRCLWSHYTA